MKQKPKKCLYCGEEFLPERRNGLYCSNTCRQYNYLTRKGKLNPFLYPIQLNQEEVPALVIEGQESGNEYPSARVPALQNKEQVIEESIDSIETIKQETIKKYQSKLPVVQFNDKGFSFIDPITQIEEEEIEYCLPKTSYEDLLEAEKSSTNQDLEFWWELNKPNNQDKNMLTKFGKRIKPYLNSLLLMNEKEISGKTLKTLQSEMASIGALYLPIDGCHVIYPPVHFFITYLEEDLKHFIEDHEPMQIPRFRFHLTDNIKARIQVIQKIIESIAINTSENWILS